MEFLQLARERFSVRSFRKDPVDAEVLKEILEAVLGIHIGDADIGKAVQRYQQKMAVVYGRPY